MIKRISRKLANAIVEDGHSYIRLKTKHKKNAGLLVLELDNKMFFVIDPNGLVVETDPMVLEQN